MNRARTIASLFMMVSLASVATRAQDIEPYHADTIKPYHADTIEPYHADTIEPYHADTITPDKPAGGPCAPVQPPVVFEGRVRNGNFQGRMHIEARQVDGRVVANVAFSDGLTGSGKLEGTAQGGVLALEGRLDGWIIRMKGRIEGATLRGGYTLAHKDGSDGQRGTFEATGHRGLDPHILGAWGMIVPGAVANWEFDRGSYIERVQQVSAGAGSGALVIEPDGSYLWAVHGEKYRGKLTYCATANGDSGWELARGKDTYWVRFIPGQNGGFYLFATSTGFYVFEGKRIPKN